MCGRFALARPADELMAELAAEGWDDISEYAPAWNLAPTCRAPVLVRADRRRLALMRWGLVPCWAQDPAIGNRLINARAETLAIKPAFQRPAATRRGLVPADGYYEWRRHGSRRQPYFVRRAGGGLLTFAALWDTWQPPAGPVVVSFTIVTCPPAPCLAALHDRMPVILSGDRCEQWLDPATGLDAALALLRPTGDDLEFFPVTAAVNSPRNDGLELIEPIAIQEFPT